MFGDRLERHTQVVEDQVEIGPAVGRFQAFGERRGHGCADPLQLVVEATAESVAPVPHARLMADDDHTWDDDGARARALEEIHRRSQVLVEAQRFGPSATQRPLRAAR